RARARDRARAVGCARRADRARVGGRARLALRSRAARFLIARSRELSPVRAEPPYGARTADSLGGRLSCAARVSEAMANGPDVLRAAIEEAAELARSGGTLSE